MTEIQKPRRSRGLKSMGAAVVAGASVVGLVLGTGTASAAVDSTNSVVDANGNLITVTLSDTFLNSVPPLDGNPLTREWFANGVAGWEVTGPDADDFEGTVKIGYQVGYPASLGGSLSIDWASPSIGASLGYEAGDETISAGVGAEIELLPTISGSIGLEPGPGVVQSESAYAIIDDSADITSSEGDAEGPSGTIQVANLHGTATGILGNVRVRPYVSVISSTGDSVVTYGAPWTFN
ncbi:MspA family porin [Rhodococcoides yunnanense]|uniref:MspA family porin n=1 Tax=Rhodococcoides yunnanense TaxID=278209 RepID=UPI0022B110A4|nr:MspA family porin [Rhodococcus yunnanensis]MCZ4277233.1 MspA family porin [Rhodococcus yunnanensis]